MGRTIRAQALSYSSWRRHQMPVSLRPLGCCSSVNAASKSKLKSLPCEDAQGNVHAIRRLYAASFASGARDTAQSMTSWFARWTTEPLKPSAIAEQDGHPAV